jgi:hypothetical protein
MAGKVAPLPVLHTSQVTAVSITETLGQIAETHVGWEQEEKENANKEAKHSLLLL